MIRDGKTHSQRRVVGKFLVMDPEICHGQITFKGTRVPVATVLALLAKGYSLEQMLKSYPEVSRPALQEAIELSILALTKKYHLKQAARRRVVA